MEVLVINLERSPDRKAFMDEQLSRTGLSYSFWVATDGPAAFDHFERCDERQYLANTGRAIGVGEAACFASHRRLWAHCVATGEPIAVLEDDARLLPSFAAAVAQAAALLPRFGFIRLQGDGASRRVRSRPLHRAGDFTLRYYTSYPFGTMAYAIDPEVARVFLDASRVLTGPVDLFVKQCWVHRQPLFGLSPACVEDSEFCAVRTIAPRVKMRLGAKARFGRWAAKLGAFFGRARFNAAFRWSQIRGGVATGRAIALTRQLNV